MDESQILNEVNDESRRNSLPELVLIRPWNHGAVSHLEHEFDRPLDVSPFRLFHFWVDLRENPGSGAF